MKVSFIIPSRQQAVYLTACLDSIAAQGLARNDFEIRVYDCASTDATTSILRNHPLQPWWISEIDRGQAAAVNRGMREASGGVIAWINADDYYLPGAVNTVLAALAENSNVEVIYGEARNVDAAGRDLGPYPVEPWSYAALAHRCFLCQPAVFFRRSVIETAGLLDESLQMALDYEYWLRLGRVKKFHYLPISLAANRVHPASKTNLQPICGRRESLLVSHRHTGQWSSTWLSALASRVSENFWAKLELHSPTLTWLGKQIILPFFHLRMHLGKIPFVEDPPSAS